MARRRKSEVFTVPAPIGGLNDINSKADMPITDALVLENWFPGTNDVSVRNGSVEHVSGLPAQAQSIFGYNGLSGKKLFAAADTAFYDVTTSGAVGAAVVTGLTNAQWQYTNFGNAGAAYIVCVNGTDTPQLYNGTTWAASGTGFATAITGVTVTGLVNVSTWKSRLWFVEKNTMKAWYLGVGAIGGAANAIDFGSLARLGGTLIACGSIPSSSGVTPDDYFFALTSEGEVFVYRGTDPSSTTTFALVGVYRVGRPIGYRCLTKMGDDVVVITADGITTLQSMLANDVQTVRAIINEKIVNTVNNAVASHKSNFGWQPVLSPIGNKLYINVPTSPGSSYQYVMNTITSAWCKFTGWNCYAMEYWNDFVYAGIGTSIYKLDVSNAGDLTTLAGADQSIIADAKTAFVYFGGKNSIKSFKMARPIMTTSGSVSPSVNVAVDFSDKTLPGAGTFSGAISSSWGSALWGTGTWGGVEVTQSKWLSVNGIGYCASLRMRATSKAITCRWAAWDLMYEQGGMV